MAASRRPSRDHAGGPNGMLSDASSTAGPPRSSPTAIPPSGRTIAIRPEPGGEPGDAATVADGEAPGRAPPDGAAGTALAAGDRDGSATPIAAADSVCPRRAGRVPAQR